MSVLTDLTIAAARAGLEAREFSARDLTDAHIAAAEAARELNTLVFETFDLARTQADAADKRLAAGEGGLLEGVPLAIKDLYCTRGVHSTACSHILDGFEPPYESTVTENLWREGAVMLGKANMDEFAMGSANVTSYYGNVINPWRRHSDDKPLVPGGSSGGSAAAVAAHMTLAATGTDTGGSIRQPAAFCGIGGLQPPYGRCSRWGSTPRPSRTCSSSRASTRARPRSRRSPGNFTKYVLAVQCIHVYVRILYTGIRVRTRSVGRRTTSETSLSLSLRTTYAYGIRTYV